SSSASRVRSTGTAVGGAAALIGAGGGGATLSATARQNRSLPTVTRHDDGSRQSYVDPRLQREVGVKSTLQRLELSGRAEVAAVAGTTAGQLGDTVDTSNAVDDPAVSATAVIRLIADAIEQGRAGLVVAIEQASITVAELSSGAHRTHISRDEPAANELPQLRVSEGVGIPISLPAYARAFEPKLRWEAAVFDKRAGVDEAPLFPPRARVDSGGTLAPHYQLVPLPRTGTVYTHTTIQIPVPDLPSPYSLALVQLDGSPVRVLLKVTGVPPSTASIGQPGTVVLRRIATRAGIPDYGYMFWPGKPATTSPEGALA
uniref:Zn-ribbon domain-containing OB-fold protein n=1 Tax=uncultured Mycobacterium sp. TaxID=171292 RepID=UPI0035CBB73A